MCNYLNIFTYDTHYMMCILYVNYNNSLMKYYLHFIDEYIEAQRS